MQSADGLSIPHTLEEMCDPQRIALLVYDMQVGILSHLKNPEHITGQVLKVLTARNSRCKMSNAQLARTLAREKVSEFRRDLIHSPAQEESSSWHFVNTLSQRTVNPPSTTRLCPVTKDALPEQSHKTASATSST